MAQARPKKKKKCFSFVPFARKSTVINHPVKISPTSFASSIWVTRVSMKKRVGSSFLIQCSPCYLSICLHGGCHQKCPNSCDGGQTDQKRISQLESPNKLLPAVLHWRMCKKRQGLGWLVFSFAYCFVGGFVFFFFIFPEAFKKFLGLKELKGDFPFVLNPPSRKTIFLDCKSGCGGRFLTTEATHTKCLFPHLGNSYN